MVLSNEDNLKGFELKGLELKGVEIVVVIVGEVKVQKCSFKGGSVKSVVFLKTLCGVVVCMFVEKDVLLKILQYSRARIT